MRLVEYLFTDPGSPPTPDHATNRHMASGEDYSSAWSGVGGLPGLPTSTQVQDQEVFPHGDPIAHLDGGFYHLPSPYSPSDAIRYRHVLGESIDETPREFIDILGVRLLEGDRVKLLVMPREFQSARAIPSAKAITRDFFVQRTRYGGGGVMLASKARGKTAYFMADPRGTMLYTHDDGGKQTRYATVKVVKVLKAARESIDEGKKREHGSYDNRAIGKLKNGNYPGRSEDGKGFCFVCSNGAFTAFRWRGDAMRWAKDEPREITKFWYGEPLSPSGKFRIRVRDRYRKDETVETFTEFLERRAVS